MRLVTEYLDSSAESFPNKPAFVDSERMITFFELKEEACKIATAIIAKRIFKGPIIIFLDKSVSCIAGFMGVAYSGNFYTPIDIKMPIERINKIIEILQPVVILTDDKNLDTVKKLDCNCDLLLYEEVMEQSVDSDIIKRVTNKIIDTDILYVLFTSGSTGHPKGVTITHRSVSAYIEWGKTTFDINTDTIFGNQTPFYFSMSVLDIYQTLKNAALMYIIPKSLFAFPIKLLEFLEEKKINTIFWVPSALCIVANLRALQKSQLTHLKKVMFAGEVMPNKQLNMWRKKVPDALFANLYGPTEVTDICTYYVVNRPFKDDEPLPIGYPCCNIDIIILNKDDQSFNTENEFGELCVRGSFLSVGYYRDKTKTAEVFVQNPLNKCYPEIIYRTGDLVRYNEYGELMYVSRKDFQIKHLGHRIELGEIETAVSAIDGVELSCCLYDEVHTKIVVFYTGTATDESIIHYLKNTLPEYMLPHKKIKLNDMPLNLNGKIDRIKLKAILKGENSGKIYC